MLLRIVILAMIILCSNKFMLAQVMPSSNPVQPIQNLPPQQRVDLEIMGLDSSVNLSEDQKAQLWQIFSTVNNQQELIKTTNETDADKMEQTKKELMQQKQQAIDQILTPEQRIRLKNANWGTGTP